MCDVVRCWYIIYNLGTLLRRSFSAHQPPGCSQFPALSACHRVRKDCRCQQRQQLSPRIERSLTEVNVSLRCITFAQACVSVVPRVLCEVWKAPNLAGLAATAGQFTPFLRRFQTQYLSQIFCMLVEHCLDGPSNLPTCTVTLAK